MRTILAAALAVAVAAPAVAADRGAAGSDPASGYVIDTSASTTQVAKGGTGKLVFVIEAKNGWHWDPRTPLKIDLTAPEGLSLEKTRLGKKDAVDPHAESPRFEAPFTGVAAGTHAAKARLDFFVCSAEACVKQVREVTVPVTVKG